jgi:hypothetical protein
MGSDRTYKGTGRIEKARLARKGEGLIGNPRRGMELKGWSESEGLGLDGRRPSWTGTKWRARPEALGRGMNWTGKAGSARGGVNRKG